MWERRDGMIICVGPKHSETHTQTSLDTTHLMWNTCSNNNSSDSRTKQRFQHGAHLFGCLNTKQRCSKWATKQALNFTNYCSVRM